MVVITYLQRNLGENDEVEHELLVNLRVRCFYNKHRPFSPIFNPNIAEWINFECLQNLILSHNRSRSEQR